MWVSSLKCWAQLWSELARLQLFPLLSEEGLRLSFGGVNLGEHDSCGGLKAWFAING